MSHRIATRFCLHGCAGRQMAGLCCAALPGGRHLGDSLVVCCDHLEDAQATLCQSCRNTWVGCPCHLLLRDVLCVKGSSLRLLLCVPVAGLA